MSHNRTTRRCWIALGIGALLVVLGFAVYASIPDPSAGANLSIGLVADGAIIMFLAAYVSLSRR